MRRLPGILLLTGAATVVIIALLVSGLRLLMPHLNSWREPILARVTALTGSPLQASALSGSWQNFGPQLEIKDIQAQLPDGGVLKIQRVTLALDVWQSLLHLRWQFRDLTFWQLHLTTNTPLTRRSDSTMATDQLQNLFLRQFDHFILRDSTFNFVTPSDQRATLAIPQLTWLNERSRHRAEGEVSLSSITGQHGVVQVRLDVRDRNGFLDTGKVWLQAENIDVKPWLSQWVRDKTRLDSANFTLNAWMDISNGDIAGGAIHLQTGGAAWQGDNTTHHLNVDNLLAHISRVQGGWQLKVPQTRFITDGQAWPQGKLALLWLPEKTQPELRVRLTDVDLTTLDPLLPLSAQLAPELLENWQQLRPRGRLQAAAADIPLNNPQQTRFQAQWRDLGWQAWKQLPAMEHLNGQLSGSVDDGRVAFRVQQAVLQVGDTFRAPLEINQASGALSWQHNAQGLTLSGEQLDVQAKSLWGRGDFRYQQVQGQPPRLDILAGINATNIGDAWRYFPQKLMGKSLTDYLSSAIQAGSVENATLIFSGNPHQFPFHHNEGMFQVAVPARNATFAFQPDWLPLTDLDVDLNFINNGLWMDATKTRLGEVSGRNIQAVIPDYMKERIVIDGDVSGCGEQVRDFFNHSTLKKTIGSALEQLKVTGEVSSRLHLDIPFDGEQVKASGDVNLHHNRVLIKPLGSTLHQLSGRFSFDNGNLHSEPMQAEWFGQPLNVSFTTREGEKDFQVGVNLQADWRPDKLALIPAALREKLGGHLPWQSTVSIVLLHHGGATYQVQAKGDFKEVSSHLPSPLDKTDSAALPVQVEASGDLHSFTLSGTLADNQRFNSRWLLGKSLRLDRGVLTNAVKTPPLPAFHGLYLNLPPINGESWLALALAAGAGSEANKQASLLPGEIHLHTPALSLAGQQWQDLTAEVSQDLAGLNVSAQGREIRGTLSIRHNAPWTGHIKYLYYNPQWQHHPGEKNTAQVDVKTLDFSRWPALRLDCEQCWLAGQNYGHIRGSMIPDGQTLKLENGLIDSPHARLTLAGEWVNAPGGQRTSIKGNLSGNKMDAATRWFGIDTPLRDSPFNITYDLHWRANPWQPDFATLSGLLKTHLGAGQIDDVSTGRTGQLLRLVSFDALLRKLRLDFRDTFRQGFYFDSINGNAWIDKGVIHTDKLLIDGLEADITMSGQMDLVNREIDMQAIVAPEVSATIGVGVAFAINPVVGAAVFAASQALAPLWNKISLLRYHISGSLDKPQVSEVLRQPREQESR